LRLASLWCLFARSWMWYSTTRQGPHTRTPTTLFNSASLFARSVPVHLHTLTARDRQYFIQLALSSVCLKPLQLSQ
jgi:hypothetical protein